MRVSVADLRAAARVLFAHLEELGVEQLELPWDYYWDVAPADAFEIEPRPATLVVGQLSEDLEWLARVVAGQEDPISYDLVKLAAVLRAVGRRLVD